MALRDLGGEVLRPDQLPSREVTQVCLMAFPVSGCFRPSMLEQALHRFGGLAWGRVPWLAGTSDEVGREQGCPRIARARAAGQLHDVEPVVQVLTELPSLASRAWSRLVAAMTRTSTSMVWARRPARTGDPPARGPAPHRQGSRRHKSRGRWCRRGQLNRPFRWPTRTVNAFVAEQLALQGDSGVWQLTATKGPTRAGASWTAWPPAPCPCRSRRRSGPC